MQNPVVTNNSTTIFSMLRADFMVSSSRTRTRKWTVLCWTPLPGGRNQVRIYSRENAEKSKRELGALRLRWPGALNRNFSLAQPIQKLRRGFRSGELHPVGALDASGLALASAQVIELSASHFTPAHHFNRADHRRVNGEDALHSNTKADAADRE